MGIFIDISIYIKKGKRSNLQLNFKTDGNKKRRKKYIKLAEGSNKNWSRYTLNGEQKTIEETIKPKVDSLRKMNKTDNPLEKWIKTKRKLKLLNQK